VLVYRDEERPVATADELRRLMTPAPPLTRLIDVGEFEAAIADALSPDRDVLNPRLEQVRAATVAAATAWIRPRDRDHLDAALATIDPSTLPSPVVLRVSEGYAFYALYPQTYAAAALLFFDTERPQGVCVIGIRSIGASLSAVVAAALASCACETATLTMRPRGDPFDRRIAMDAGLAARLRECANRGWSFAVVDEGPGLSGSSFASVTTALRGLGIASSRVALFPAWDPEPETLKSHTARQVWTEYRRYVVGPAEIGISPERVFGVAGSAIDFSAGRWRSTLIPDIHQWPAVQPQHERWKTFLPGEQRLLKFVGLGRYGMHASARAERLADAGLAPAPGCLQDGFLDLPFLAGIPIARIADTSDAAVIGDYIGRIASVFPERKRVGTSALRNVIVHNLRGMVPDIEDFELPTDVSAAAIDGRMLPQEWLRTDRGLVKVDALDHCRDHFFPGWQSPAWDLAGAAIEMDMNATETAAMIDAFERASGDRDAARVLDFYRLAYSAFRFGYARMAVPTLDGTLDSQRFDRLARRYSQCALNAAACLTASSKSPRKQIARSSMKT
jgi:hypothetical protein